MFSSWAAMYDGYALRAAESSLHAAQIESYKRQMELKLLAIPVRHHPGDCQSCGSQEFRLWAGRSVCSYCRSIAPHTASLRPSPISITRPQAYARITTD